jgi:hypothetical protein
MASVLGTAEGITHVEFMPRGTGVSGCVGPLAVLCVCRPAARQRNDRELLDRPPVLFCGQSFVWATAAARGSLLFHSNEEVEVAVREWL